MNDCLMKSIFYKFCGIWFIKKPLKVRFVFCKKNFLRLIEIKEIFTQIKMMRLYAMVRKISNKRLVCITCILPIIIKPESRQKCNGCCLRATVHYFNPDKNILTVLLCIFHKNIEIFIITENTCIQDLIFRL